MILQIQLFSVKTGVEDQFNVASFSVQLSHWILYESEFKSKEGKAPFGSQIQGQYLGSFKTITQQLTSLCLKAVGQSNWSHFLKIIYSRFVFN